MPSLRLIQGPAGREVDGRHYQDTTRRYQVTLPHCIHTEREINNKHNQCNPTHGCGEATLSLPTDRREADFDGPPTQVTY